MSMVPKVDLCFHVTGKTLAVDHGYALYGAVSRVLPHFHEADDVGLKLIRGRYIGDGLLDISPFSRLVLRLPVDVVSAYLPLAGKRLEVLGRHLLVGVPRTRAVESSAAAHSPLVTTRNGDDQSRFERELAVQMKRLDINGGLAVQRRRTFRIHGKQVVGFAVTVSGMSPQGSIRLQEHGLGGRRKMGCGFFEPHTNGRRTP